MSKPWGGGIGAWAEEAERADAEEREQRLAAAAAAVANSKVEPQSFPSLKEAAAAKPKKKKQQTMSMSEFMTGTYVGPGGAARGGNAMESRGLTTQEMLRLPTGPKERSPEEMEYGRLGGGFKSYGTRSGPQGGGGRMRGGDDEGSWGGGGGGGGGGRRSYGGFDDDRRAPPPRGSDYDQPSRADEVDNWAMGKKSMPSMDSGRNDGRHELSGRNDRYSSLGGGSRADDVDNWATGKKPVAARTTSFGSGFRDSTGPEPDRWNRGERLPPPRDVDRGGERTRIVLDPPRTEGALNEPAKLTRPSPFAAARPREEVLAAKGLDWRKLDSDIETKKTTSRPTSSHSSRPTSAHSSRPQSPATQVVEVAAKPRPKVNPFGDAKPREVLLQEKGKDWRKMDFELEHRGVDRPETEEEKMLKEEIENLKKEVEKEDAINVNGESLDGVSGAADKTSLHEMIKLREKDLELLIRELDDKVRFGQKAATERPGSGAGRAVGYPERPGSGAGRVIGYPERPPSQSGRSEDSRNMEFMDRPRSRGTGEGWNRPVDDRRGFQGGRERGFLGNRDMDRSRGGDRW